MSDPCNACDGRGAVFSCEGDVAPLSTLVVSRGFVFPAGTSIDRIGVSVEERTGRPVLPIGKVCTACGQEREP